MIYLLFLGLVVLVVVYINKTSILSTRLEELRRETRGLRDVIQELQSKVSSTAISAQTADPSKVEQVGKVPAAKQIVPTSPVAPTSQAPLAAPRPVVTPVSKPSRTREEWEALIGGKLLNRIGALALIIGVGFFLKYAVDNNWISEWVRVCIGFLIGVGLLFGAFRAHKKKFDVFAQGLVGAGISILYLSVYASFNFYHLVSQPVAFGVMSLVTAVTFLQAFKYDSLAVAVLGWAGGFLTPFLLSTGSPNEIGLFTYIALLDAGLLAVVVAKDRWVVLEPLTLVATYVVYFSWFTLHYTTADLLPTVYFLTVFWALFFVLDVYRSRRAAISSPELRQVVSMFSVLVYYSTLYVLINPDHHDMMGLITGVLGVIYFVTALVLQPTRPIGGTMFTRFTITAIVLLVLATAIQFSGFDTVMWWSVEALFLVACGLYWNLRYVWLSALALFGLAILKLLSVPGAAAYLPISEFQLLVNKRAHTFLLLALSVGISGNLIRRESDPTSVLLRQVLRYAWTVLCFLLVTLEIVDHFRLNMVGASSETIADLEFTRFMTLAVVWMVYSVPLIWFGLREGESPLLHAGLGVMTLAACLAAVRGIAFDPVINYRFLVNSRVVAILLIIGGLLIHARWLRKGRDTIGWLQDVLNVLAVAVVVLLLVLFTGETRDLFEKQKLLLDQSISNLNAEQSRLNNLEQMSLSAVWLVYSIVLMGVGIWRRARGLRLVSIVLFGFTILKIFIYDLSFLETLYRIFSFVGLGVILLVVSYLYQRYKSIIVGSAAAEGTTGEPQ